jgi:hypothetical protein
VFCDKCEVSQQTPTDVPSFGIVNFQSSHKWLWHITCS